MHHIPKEVWIELHNMLENQLVAKKRQSARYAGKMLGIFMAIALGILLSQTQNAEYEKVGMILTIFGTILGLSFSVYGMLKQ